MKSGRAVGAWTLLIAATVLAHLLAWWLYVDGLSRFLDTSYSEASSLRAAERFVVEGVGPTCGLPDYAYGDRFPGMGITEASGHRPDDPVYHGDPPGATWLNTLYARLFGFENLDAFRLGPIVLGLIAAWVFAWSLAKTIGPSRAAVVYGLCLAAPMFTNLMHSLYYYGYALSLWLLELAVLFRMFDPKTGDRGGRRDAGRRAALGLLGFLQGWLSYDHAGVVAFSAIPVAWLLTPSGRPVPWRRVAAAVVVPGVGFVLAHALHFLLSAWYFGSLAAAVKEYAFRSGKTYDMSKTWLADQPTWLIWLVGLGWYLDALLRWRFLLSPASLVVLAMTAAVLGLRRASGVVRGLGWWFEAEFRATGRHALALGVAYLIGCSWLFLKPFHALNHLNYNSRHLFLFYVACCLFVAVATDVRIARRPSAEAGVGRSRPRVGGESLGGWPDPEPEPEIGVLGEEVAVGRNAGRV